MNYMFATFRCLGMLIDGPSRSLVLDWSPPFSIVLLRRESQLNTTQYSRFHDQTRDGKPGIYSGPVRKWNFVAQNDEPTKLSQSENERSWTCLVHVEPITGVHQHSSLIKMKNFLFATEISPPKINLHRRCLTRRMSKQPQSIIRHVKNLLERCASKMKSNESRAQSTLAFLDVEKMTFLEFGGMRNPSCAVLR